MYGYPIFENRTETEHVTAARSRRKNKQDWREGTHYFYQLDWSSGNIRDMSLPYYSVTPIQSVVLYFVYRMRLDTTHSYFYLVMLILLSLLLSICHSSAGDGLIPPIYIF